MAMTAAEEEVRSAGPPPVTSRAAAADRPHTAPETVRHAPPAGAALSELAAQLSHVQAACLRLSDTAGLEGILRRTAQTLAEVSDELHRAVGRQTSPMLHDDVERADVDREAPPDGQLDGHRLPSPPGGMQLAAPPRPLAHQAFELASALMQERLRNTNLRIALETNRDISAAIGILMARHTITREQAFERLRIASQHRHVKLHRLACEVLETGTLELPQLRQLPSRGSPG